MRRSYPTKLMITITKQEEDKKKTITDVNRKYVK